MSEIALKEEQVQKIWYCFIKLPEPYYSYIYDLYVEGKPYKKVQEESGVSNRAFANRRNKAIRTIQMFYDYSTLDEINISETEEHT